MQAPNATLLSSKRKLSLPLDNLLIGASTSDRDQQAGPVSKRTRIKEPARGGKTYSLLGPAPSADSQAPDAFPFMFNSKKSPDRISIPLHNLNPLIRIHPSLAETEDIPGPSLVLPPSVDSSYNHSTMVASSGALLKDIWNGLRLFCSNFDIKKYIFVSPLLKNITMRNVFTFHTRLSNIFCATPAVSGSVSEAVASESDWNDAAMQAKSPSLEPTLLSNRISPSSSTSVPATPTGPPYQRMHNEESDCMPGLAASVPSLAGTGDEGSNSYVDANNHYLQAEIECLIQHEVKTKGMQTHFRNLLTNAPGSDLHDILRGIYTYVGSTHCNDSLPHTGLDKSEVRQSRVGDHVDPIAISIQVENSSCQVDIRVKN